jgi:hypothetical protein
MATLKALKTWAGTAALGLALACGVSAQAPSTSILGPFLGFVPDLDGGRIHPILGIPGAAAIGEAWDLGPGIHSAIVAPGHDYALAIQGDDARVVIVGLTPERTAMRLDSVAPGADRISLSPNGSAAAVYNDAARTLQVIGGLPESPRVAFGLPAPDQYGEATGLAVSDDATLALVGMSDPSGGRLWVADSSGSWQVLAHLAPNTVAFLPDSHDAIATDQTSGEALLLLDLPRAATRVPVHVRSGDIGNVSVVGAGDHGRRILVADRESGNVAVADRSTGHVSVVSCLCRPTGFDRLNGAGLFRLNTADGGALSVLDLSSDPPRIRLIPPAP